MADSVPPHKKAYWVGRRRATVINDVAYGAQVEVERATKNGFHVRVKAGQGYQPEGWDAFEEEVFFE